MLREKYVDTVAGWDKFVLHTLFHVLCNPKNPGGGGTHILKHGDVQQFWIFFFKEILSKKSGSHFHAKIPNHRSDFQKFLKMGTFFLKNP